MVLLTDRALVVIGRSARLRIALPGPASSLERADVAPRRNGGWVASFLFGRQTGPAETGSFRRIVSVDGDGRAASRTVALRSDLPMLFRCDDFWLSPVLDGIYEGAKGLGAPRDPLVDSRLPMRSPACLLAALVSVLLAGAWMVRGRFSPRRQAAWLMATVLLGLPGLIGLVLVFPAAPADAVD